MSHVEAFATEIKIESSDQSPFNQAAIWPLTLWKSSAQEAQKGMIKQLSTFFAHQKPRSQLQTLE